MWIEVNTGRIRGSGEELAAISRESVNFGWELNSVYRQLRQISQMEECRKALNDQQEALNVIAVRLARMGDGLARISEAYHVTEMRNSIRLEECAPVQTVQNATVYSVQQEFKERIDRILYK